MLDYPQRLDECSTPKFSRKVYLILHKYIDHNEGGFSETLQRTPGLKKTLEDLLWLQRAVLNTPNPLDGVNHTPQSSTSGPTMSLCKLLAEAEECAWIIIDELPHYELNALGC
ncbi:hypothetical protein PENSUB_4443 [Penicillium subrubescens]|uniref:Uncharacterized protein n=1 Tax=Penicillium subrubescens TaxID=1316194 RepID=A0A1Q5UR54_9EURO|nr:hypothetical protein PENSUB_4443 [Penicillium subrubescens]